MSKEKQITIPKAVVGVIMLLFGVFLATHTPWHWIPDPIEQGGRMLVNEAVLLYTIFGSWLYVSWVAVRCDGDELL
jgi:putative effector of murein hydrolase LrgA (UPF0299 family)